jgi:hypothetical protein
MPCARWNLHGNEDACMHASWTSSKQPRNEHGVPAGVLMGVRGGYGRPQKGLPVPVDRRVETDRAARSIGWWMFVRPRSLPRFVTTRLPGSGTVRSQTSRQVRYRNGRLLAAHGERLEVEGPRFEREPRIEVRGRRRLDPSDGRTVQLDALRTLERLIRPLDPVLLPARTDDGVRIPAHDLHRVERARPPLESLRPFAWTILARAVRSTFRARDKTRAPGRCLLPSRGTVSTDGRGLHVTPSIAAKVSWPSARASVIPIRM